MAYVEQQAPRRGRVVDDGLPKPRAGELKKFKEHCTDPGEVMEFAASIRRLGAKYQTYDDDYELCVVYLKEQHINHISENIAVAIPSISVIGTPIITKFPSIQVFMTGLMTNSPKISEWISYFYQPNLSLTTNNDEEKFANSIIPIPRDEVTIREMKTVLDDCKVPKAVTNGALEMFKGNFGLQPVLAGIQIIINCFRPGATADTSGVASQLAMFE